MFLHHKYLEVYYCINDQTKYLRRVGKKMSGQKLGALCQLFNAKEHR